jgi:ABC-type phosphate transport system auxiliary subunit
VKTYTADQVERKQAKAVQFLRDVVGDDDKADEFEDMDLDEYAEHKGIEIVNSEKRSPKTMAGNGNGRTKQDLLDEIDDLQQENQSLQDQLDAISDIVNPPEEDEDEDDGDDGDDDQYPD